MVSIASAARIGRWTGLIGALACAGMTVAQTVDDTAIPQTGLDLPDNLQLFGKFDPNVRKPTAIVNDTVITGTDVDQRVALLAAANSIKMTPELRDRLRLQVVRSLIDEVLQVQEAKSHDVTITSEEVDQSFTRVASNFNRNPAEMRKWLREIGSSERSIRRQIEAELAWSRLLRRRVQPFVNVGEEEVKSILDRMRAAQGTSEYHLKEIYISAPAERADQGLATARAITDMIQNRGTSTEKGQPFEYYALRYSEASTRAVSGDLGWIRTAQLPESLARAATEMEPGQIAGPIPVPGGYSILYLIDRRQVLTADPRDARLSLRQMSIRFPEGTTQAQAAPRIGAFAKAAGSINGCGGVAAVAATIGAEVVDNDQVRIRDLPPQLQQILVQMQVGQATPPFGAVTDSIRTLVLCGRDDSAAAALPSAEQIQGQLEEQRVNLRAQRMMRDLRRDAIVEYR